MSQADKERVIAELRRKVTSGEFSLLIEMWPELAGEAYDAGAKAGYIAAKEDAATIAEAQRVDGFITYSHACTRVAAAIRKLEPKP